MKKVLLFALALALTGCAKKPVIVTPPGPPVDFPVTIHFNYDFTNFFVCSATVAKGCVSGFSWGYMQGATQVPLDTVTTAACSGAQPQTCSDLKNSQLPIGSVIFYVRANIIDNVGVIGQSAPGLTVPSAVPADAPTNVTESHQ